MDDRRHSVVEWDAWKGGKLYTTDQRMTSESRRHG